MNIYDSLNEAYEEVLSDMQQRDFNDMNRKTARHLDMTGLRSV